MRGGLGSGFRVRGVRVQSPGFGGLGFRVQGEVRVQSLGLRVRGSVLGGLLRGSGVGGVGCMVSGECFWAWGVGILVWGVVILVWGVRY